MVTLLTDPWIPDHPPRSPRPLVDNAQNEKVSSYFNEIRSDWNEEKLRQFVVQEDVDHILAIKISSKAVNDLLGWHYNDDGIYTVKSGYWLGSHLLENDNPIPIPGNAQLKNKIWKTKLPAKLKHFLWRVFSNSLAIGSNLKRRHVIQDDQCRRYCARAETEDHIFFGCYYAKQIWRESGFTNGIIADTNATLEEKIEACLQSCSSNRLDHFQELPIWVLWRLWKSRNILVFQHKQIHWKATLKYARNDATEWKQVGNTKNTEEFQMRRGHRSQDIGTWKRPPRNWIKCNVDGSYVQADGRSTAGWIYRDELGVFKGACQAQVRRVMNPLECELQSILMALQHCWVMGYKKIVLENDCQKTIEILQDKARHFNLYNWIREIKWWSTRFEEVQFQWISRGANKCADKLAKNSVIHELNFVFHNYVPHIS